VGVKRLTSHCDEEAAGYRIMWQPTAESFSQPAGLSVVPGPAYVT